MTQLHSVNNDSLINLERFQIAYRGHYLINPRPISILYSNDNFLFEPFEVHVDDGILEPLRITRQAISGATEAAVSILRIDDVLWAKTDAVMPEMPEMN